MSLTNIVLIGASGNIGSIILSSLLASSQLQVTALSREGSTSTIPSHPNLRTIQTKYDLASLTKAFSGQDAVISAVGAGGLGDQKVFVDAAVAAGVKRFMPSEFSVNTLSPAVRDLVPLFEAKLQLLEHLKSKKNTGLSWTGLAAGLLFDWGLKAGTLGFDLSRQSATLWDDGETKFSVTNQGDLGKAVVGVIAHPQETANQYLYVASVTTTQNAILKSLENHSDEKWSKTHLETDQTIEAAKEKAATGDFGAVFTLVQASTFGKVPGIRANYEADEMLANDILGLDHTTVDETIKTVLKTPA